MGRESGRLGRFLGRIFRERQIYHRSDGIVRFIKLSTRTQLALATVGAIALAWIAYSSVNVVFKEQIIVAKEKERRDQENEYRRQIYETQKATDGTNALNLILSNEYDAAIGQINNNLDILEDTVLNKRAFDKSYDELKNNLSENGAIGGKEIQNGNRIMVDAVGREPTPRQSRISRLREETLNQILHSSMSEGMENDMVKDYRKKSGITSARQVLILAQVEEDIRRRINEVETILTTTGINADAIIAKTRIKQTATAGPSASAEAQGGPFVDAYSLNGEVPVFSRMAERVNNSLEEVKVLTGVMKSLPLSIPIKAPHRQTSPYGHRWDPKNRKRRAMHKGMDYAGAWNSPIVSTAPGRVKYAGTRGAFGRVVEIDHGNGFVTRYAHLNRINVKTGQKVQIHQKIGQLGSSGKSTGPHVHYEILYKGRQVNPANFMKAGRYVFES